MDASRLKTLVLYANYTTRLSYYDDWLDAFRSSAGFDVKAVNICNLFERKKMDGFARQVDLIVLLHSTNADTIEYLRPFVPVLQGRRGLLLSFVGNEVNLPGVPIRDKREIFSRMEPDFIATQLPLEAGQFLFGDLVRRRVISVPHALNPDVFMPRVPQRSREIDIGVRSVRYLPHLGDNDRNRLYDYFLVNGAGHGLKTDISTERLDRGRWSAFLNHCRGTVSTEAGSWFLERDDRTVEAIRAWTADRMRGRFVIKNNSVLQRLGHKLPWGMRLFIKRMLGSGPLRHESSVAAELPYEEVFDRFFRNYQKPQFYGKCVSSRHFDAVGTKTCQIMFPGRFNDIFQQGEHYIAIAPDFSNIGDVIEKFRDVDFRTRLVDQTYDYVRDAHTYLHRMAAVYAAVTAA